MGRRGPRPTPTALKIAKGTVRGTDKAKETMGVRIELPEAPEGLGEEGRKAWERYGKVAEACGLLEERFLSALERLSDAHDRLAEADADRKVNGPTQLTQQGIEIARPCVAMAKDCREEIRRYLVEFGLTPAAAANVKIVRDDRPTSVKRRERA